MGTGKGRSFRAALAGASATVARVWQRLRGRRRGGEGSLWDKERRRGTPMGVVGPARPGGSLRDPSGAFGSLCGSCTDEGSRRLGTSPWPSPAGCGRHGVRPPGLVAAEAEGRSPTATRGLATVHLRVQCPNHPGEGRGPRHTGEGPLRRGRSKHGLPKAQR